MNIELIEKLEIYAKHFAELFDTSCRIVDIENYQFVSKVFGSAPNYVPHCTNEHCTLINVYSYGCNEAYRWGGKYIFYCPEGFVFVAASVSDETGNLAGGMVLGPIIMGDLDDMLEMTSNKDAIPCLKQLANIPTNKVNHIAEIMAAVTENISGVSHSLIGSVSFKQENFLQSLYSSERLESGAPDEVYPIETEKQLSIVIRDGDKKGAQALLNELLGKIYIISQFDVDTIKIRIMELLSVMSRSTIEAGADPNEIIWFNTGCVREMRKCSTIEELSVWITEVMHRFINYSFDFSSVKHSDTVYKVIEYIRANYYKKISLNEISKYVNFSKTYLSRIFKDETGENISTYINKVRIEKAKLFLADKSISLVDVANLTGFEDQSYFTKVFKSITGMSPKKYKESRKKTVSGTGK